MIDEELYQLAAEELNSERRRPHIWARACALASDDHDEARYLYTNLRVEELLAERAAKEASGSDSAPAAQAVGDLALEPLEEQREESADGLLERAEEANPDTDLVRPGDALGERSTGDDALVGAQAESLFPRSDDDAFADGQAERPARESDEDGFADGRAERLTVPEDDDVLAEGRAERLTLPEDDDVLAEGRAERLTLPEDDDVLAEGRAEPPGSAEGGDDALIGRQPDSAFRESVRAGETSRPEPFPVAQSGTDDGPAAAAAESVRDEPRLALDTAPSFDLELDELGHADEARDATSEPVDEAVAAETVAASDRLHFSADTAGSGADGAVGTTMAARAVADDEGAAQTAEWLDETFSGDDTDRIGRRPAAAPAASRGGADLDWLDEDIRDADAVGHADDTGDPFARELARQAEELPEHDGSALIEQERRSAKAVDEKAVDETGTTVVADGAPLELDDDDDPGVDVEHAVFVAADGTAQGVRQGRSWGALLFTLPWLLRYGLLGTALLYALFAVVVLAGLVLTAGAWLEAGASASLATRAATVAFALLALCGLFWVPFRRANGWREDKLERRGYELAAYVRARRPERAIALAREAREARPRRRRRL